MSALVMLVPALVSVIVYDMKEPTYLPSAELMETITEDHQTNATNDPSFLESFAAKAWKKLSMEEKTALAQLLINYECEKIGIPAVPIHVEKQRPETMAGFNSSSYQIAIDTQHLKSANSDDLVKTLFHETWHAEQHYIIENFPWESDMANNIYFEEVQAWRENDEGYYSGIDYDKYEEQPLETSAREFAENEWKAIHELIYK